MSAYDNVTRGEALALGVADFRIQGVPGERLRIKDGDIEIQQLAGVTYANNVPAIAFDGSQLLEERRVAAFVLNVAVQNALGLGALCVGVAVATRG